MKNTSRFQNPPDWPLNTVNIYIVSHIYRSINSLTWFTSKDLQYNDELWRLSQKLGQSVQHPARFPWQTCSCKIIPSSLAWSVLHIYSSLLLQCNDFNETSSYITPLQAANNADRSWLFQQCTEFGFFMPTYGSVFPLLGLEHQVRWCGKQTHLSCVNLLSLHNRMFNVLLSLSSEKIFGIPNLQPDTEAVNAYYGYTSLHSFIQAVAQI